MNENETTPTEAPATEQPTAAPGEVAAPEATTPTEQATPADEATPASDGAAAEAAQGEGRADDKMPSSITPEQLAEDLKALFETHIKRGGSVAGFGAAGASWAAMTAVAGGLTLKQHQRLASHAYLLAICKNTSIGPGGSDALVARLGRDPHHHPTAGTDDAPEER